MEKQSKRYRSALKVADLAKEYTLKEAAEVLAKFPKTKFDETVEVSFHLGVDAAQGDQMVRGTTPLPHGTGKKVRVIVFGHTHAPCNEEVGGVLLFNPGSPTDMRFAPYCSFGILTVQEGEARGEIVRL